MNKRFLLSMMLLSAIAVVVSLGTVLRAYAMPVEARSTESWYAYHSTLGVGFVAHVVPGRYYPNARMMPDELMRLKMPVDPPVYRRTLISKFTESLEVKLDYQFEGDRPAPATRAKLRVDGMLQVPGFWQQPYPLISERELSFTDQAVRGTETLSIPIAKFLADIESARKIDNLGMEPFEVVIRPTLEVSAEGLRQPVHVLNQREFRITIRGAVVEVDEPVRSDMNEKLTETRVVPLTLRILGHEIKVETVRRVSLYTLVGFLLLSALFLWARRGKADTKSLIQRLGPNLLSVTSFEIPRDAAVAEVRTVKELLQLHLQTERPVIQVGRTYYLMDGSTCYRFQLSAQTDEAIHE